MKSIPIILFLMLAANLYCQDFSSKKSIYLELGGSAGIGSINYEHVFRQKGKFDLLYRVGMSGFPIDKNNGFVFVVPTTLGALVGAGNNKFEAGIGQGLSITTKGKVFSLVTPIIGYRYQNRNKRVYFRVLYTPLISYILDFQYQNWAGISIGYSLNFKK